ncbi:MAG: NAD(P)H-dependent oxidoreductase [Campylobacteraceae bacterium]|jgi:putative NADPH-quinone reductase|nr:NAD(P)H-dependent oxidoreductase [Campylobacteraceae bacterium]
MAKNILIINGHPDKESLNHVIASAYERGAVKNGATVERINIGELDFDLNLKFGYKKDMELEQDLKDSIEKIRRASHIVFIHPLWWGSYPAIMKGFIDRVFLPDIAFSYNKNNKREMLLRNKSARIIVTMEQPVWYYKFVCHSPSIKQLKTITLAFCGIKSQHIKSTLFGSVINSTQRKRKQWLLHVEKLGGIEAVIKSNQPNKKST